MKITILGVLVSMVLPLALPAQETPSVPWRFGAHLGVNYNMAGVGYSNWLSIPERPYGNFGTFVLNDGDGFGAYAGLDAQWMIADWFGLNGRLSYDMRSLTAIDDQTYKNPDGSAIKDEYTFNLGLLNLEVLAKLYIGRRFHVTGGGGLGFKIADTYDYRLDSKDPAVTGTKIEGATAVGSFAGGFGYDIPLSEPTDKTQWFITPFAEVTYMVGMKEVHLTDQSGFADGLSVVTVRAGAAIMFGEAELPEAAPAVAPMGKLFMITPPPNGVYEKRVVAEYYPLRPFVFFDKNNTEIPARYNNITSGDTSALIERAMHGWTTEDLSNVEARKYRQGEAYYNILNIVGYRMNHTPAASLTLIGSDPNEKNGDVLAETTKRYLTNTWGIDAGRINTQSQVMPRMPSGTARTPAADKPLVDIENRRVEIISSDPSLMRRAVIKAEETPGEENQITVGIQTNESIESYQVMITGNGQHKTFGPFTYREAYIDATGLIADPQTSGKYLAEVIAKTTDGRTLSDTASFMLTLNKAAAQAQRNTLIFEYNEEDPVKRSDEFLADLVPGITNGSTVVISGFTDNIGSVEANKKLAQDRADEVKTLLMKRLKDAGKHATVRAIGYGEDAENAPFPNNVPEGRMYNRTVIVDVFP